MRNDLQTPRDSAFAFDALEEAFGLISECVQLAHNTAARRVLLRRSSADLRRLRRAASLAASLISDLAPMLDTLADIREREERVAAAEKRGA